MVRVAACRDQFMKTKMCPHVRAGGCRRGSVCCFAHSASELRSLPNLQKTRLCEMWQKQGSCPNGPNCPFAHGEKELKFTSAYFKTDLCKYWKSGFCGAGDECRHAHGIPELRPRNFKANEGISSREGCNLDMKDVSEGRISPAVSFVSYPFSFVSSGSVEHRPFNSLSDSPRAEYDLSGDLSSGFGTVPTEEEEEDAFASLKQCGLGCRGTSTDVSIDQSTGVGGTTGASSACDDVYVSTSAADMMYTESPSCSPTFAPMEGPTNMQFVSMTSFKAPVVPICVRIDDRFTGIDATSGVLCFMPISKDARSPYIDVCRCANCIRMHEFLSSIPIDLLMNNQPLFYQD